MEDNQFIGEDSIKLLCYPANGETLKVSVLFREKLSTKLL